MLTDLPVMAVRYAALLNIAVRTPELPMRMIAWVRHAVGVYEQVGFEHLPWLVQWPHEVETWALTDLKARRDALARQGGPRDYGSADSIGQVLARYTDLATSDRRYLLTYQTVTRKDDPGWRWHKNGPYIGVGHPRQEHLGDEPEIDKVIAWEVWEVLPHVADLTGRWRPELDEWLIARMSGQISAPPALR